MRLSYRPDIDGLRAIAVAIVVAFHAGVPGCGGGFIGVDVFLVISGFLITGLLVEELRETGSISLSRFYARRVRRLLPALALVLVATMLLGSVLLLGVAGEQQALAKSALAATLSVSNVWFWSVSNYFTVALAVARARSRQRPRRA
jgi:peptidoglycan/LPS O-acetylase OafA/YrhL